MAVNSDNFVVHAAPEETAERGKTGFARWLIRNLARFAVLLTVYPTLDFIFNGCMGYTAADVWMMTGMCVVCGFLSCAICSLLYRSGSEKLVVAVRILLGAAFAAAFVFLSFIPASNNYPILSAMCFPIAGIVMSIVGGGLSEREMSQKDFVVATILYIISFVGLNAQNAVYSMNTFIWLYLYTAVIYAVLRNYDKIDLLMSRRGHSKAKLPTSIRGFNLALLAVVFGAGLVFVLFRTFFAGILEDVFTSVVLVVGLLFKLLFSKVLIPLTEMFFMGKHQATTGKGGLETIDMNALLGLEETESFAENPLYVATIVLAAALTLFVLGYYLGKPIAKWFSTKFSKLALFLRKRLYRNSELKGSFAGDDNEYYTEVNETLDSGSIQPESEDVSSRELRQWRGKVRDYGKMPRNADTFLYGYRLSSAGLALKGVRIRPSDTALEVLAKSEGIVADAGFEAATNCANSLTFNDRSGQADFESLDRALEQIKDYKPEPKKKEGQNQETAPRKWWQRRSR